MKLNSRSTEKQYAARVLELEAEGLTTSDAQGAADAEMMNAKGATKGKAKAIPFSEIRARYNPGSGRHFFDKDTLRFFRSKLPRVGYEGPGGVYFVTSEQFVGSDRVASPRRYTVRCLEGEGRIQTVGKFNVMDRDEATAWAKEYASDPARQQALAAC